MEISDLRRDYRSGELHRRDLDPDPFVQFERWFMEAEADPRCTECNAMTLATSDTSGFVTARTVLLKDCDSRGFVFFTNYGSLKARQIAANPHVALLFPWLQMERQVSICGQAQKISRAESEGYFRRRPFENQIGAWASSQSAIAASRAELEARFETVRAKFAGGEVPMPESWGGFRVAPRTMEFWQGRAGRLHDRFLYTRKEEGWTIHRLSP